MTDSTVHTQRSYVVTESAESPEYSITHTQRAYVVTTPLAAGGLGQAEVAERPEYIVENGTPYVKFEPNTNNKKLFFYPETDGTYTIIALRPNLLDFFESTQVFAGPAQVEAPHFNQLFMTDRTLEDAERNQIKQGMLSRATGSGIDIEASTPNSVIGGLKDPYIPGVIGAPPPSPGGATLLDSTKYTGSGNISQAHVFDPSTTLTVVVVNNVMSSSGNPITPVMTINGEAATRDASTYYGTGFTEGAFAFSVSNPSSGDIVYAGDASQSWMMTVYEFSSAAVGIAVDQGVYTGQSGSPISTLSAAGDYVIHAITLGREDGDTVTSFSGGAFESHDPAGAYYTGASAIVEDASGTYSWSFTGGTDSYQYRVAIPILDAVATSPANLTLDQSNDWVWTLNDPTIPIPTGYYSGRGPLATAGNMDVSSYFTVTSDGELFWDAVASSEGNYDFGYMYVNGVETFKLSGTQSSVGSVLVSAGDEVRTRYTKDGSVNAFSDTIYFDELYVA